MSGSARGCWLGFLALVLVVVPAASAADEKKKSDPPKPEPPRLLMSVPGGVATGVSNRVTLRGLTLTNVVAVWAAETPSPVNFQWGKPGPAKLPDKADLKKVGDTQIEVGFLLPTNWAGSTLTLVASNAVGASAPLTLRVVPENTLRAEKEPNNGFGAPQLLDFPAAVPGVIDAALDVDVFRFKAKSGQRLSAAVFAARQGSPLDAILTLYNERGSVLLAVDDSPSGRDPAMSFQFPADGTFFLGINDAHDTGGSLHLYWLDVRLD